MVRNNELKIEALESFIALVKLTKSDKRIISSISNTYIPYLSLLCDDYKNIVFDKNNDLFDTMFEFPNFSKMLIKNRNFLKLKTDLNKPEKIFLKYQEEINYFNDYLTRDYSYKQKIYVKLFGQPDLSVHSFRGVPYYNNYFGNLYLKDVVENFTTFKEFKDEIINLSRDITICLQLITQIDYVELESIKKKQIKLLHSPKEFDLNDFFLKKRFFKSEINPSEGLFLFNLLCQINYTSIILPYVLGFKGNLYYRIKIINYLILIKGLWILSQQTSIKSKIFSDLLNSSNKLFNNEDSRSVFRNHIFHLDTNAAENHSSWIEDLTKSTLKLDFETLNEVIDETFQIANLEINQILFGRERIFLGSNIKAH